MSEGVYTDSTITTPFARRSVVGATATSVAAPALALAFAFNTLSPTTAAYSRFISETAEFHAPESGFGRFGSAKRADLLTISEVRKLSTYDAGWKGEGSFGPTPEALSDTETFVRSLFREADVKRPHVGLESSGEINLFWNMGDAVIDLGITGDGTYSYFAEIHGEKHYGDELPIGQSLPADILAKITAAA